MSERREACRRRVYLGGRISHAVLVADTACLLRNLSAGGARIVLADATPLPRRFTLAIACRGTVQTVETVWRDGAEIGVRFVVDEAESESVLGLRDSLRESREAVGRLQTRIAELELVARPAGEPLH